MNRAIRRHHRERIFAKRLKQNTLRTEKMGDPSRSNYVESYFNQKEWAVNNARRRINTTKPHCKCHSCRLHRAYKSSYGNSWTGRGLSRVSADNDMRDQLNDL